MIETASETASTRAPSDSVARFVEYLEKLAGRDDRAALAKLRRSLIEYGRDFSAYTVLGYALPANISESKERLYLLVAGLYAMHNESVDDGRTFGTSLRRLRIKLGDIGGKSLDGLVGGVLNAEGEDLPIRLRHVIARLASNDVPVDYRQLLRDLLSWESPSRWVQRRWAHDYWVARDEMDPDADGEAPEGSGVGGEAHDTGAEIPLD